MNFILKKNQFMREIFMLKNFEKLRYRFREKNFSNFDIFEKQLKRE